MISKVIGDCSRERNRRDIKIHDKRILNSIQVYIGIDCVEILRIEKRFMAKEKEIADSVCLNDDLCIIQDMKISISI